MFTGGISVTLFSTLRARAPEMKVPRDANHLYTDGARH